MNKSIYIFLFCFLFITVGCTAPGNGGFFIGSKTEFRKFDGHIEELKYPEGVFRRVKGSNILFEIYHFSSGPLLAPTAWGGYSLFIESSRDILKTNTTITIPDKNVRVIFYSDYHHIGQLRNNISGEIKVKDLNNKYALLNIELTINDIDMEIKYNEKFKNFDISKYSQIER